MLAVMRHGKGLQSRLVYGDDEVRLLMFLRSPDFDDLIDFAHGDQSLASDPADRR